MKKLIGIAATLMAVTSPQVLSAVVNVGDSAPDFSVTTLSGEQVSLSDYKGKKPVYLKFWATWCSYCIVEMPHLQDIENRYGDDIEVLAVNVGINDSVANIQKLYQSEGFNLPTTIDQRGALTSLYGVVGTPNHVLINRDGIVEYRTFLATDALDGVIEKWVAEAANQDSQENK